MIRRSSGRWVMRVLAAFALAASLSAAGAAGARAAEGGSAAEETDEWLPIGSVVTVRGYDRKFVILGRVVQNAGDGLFYDYCACLCPDGYMGGNLYFFNRGSIDEVLMKGFEDEYEQLYRMDHLDGVDVSTLGGNVSPETESEAGQTEAQPPAETAAEGSEAPAAGESETAASAESEAAAGRTYVTLQNVRLREGPSTDSESLVTVPGEREVTEDTAREASGDWVPVIFRDSSGQEIKGYIRKDFLQEK